MLCVWTAALFMSVCIHDSVSVNLCDPVGNQTLSEMQFKHKVPYVRCHCAIRQVEGPS